MGSNIKKISYFCISLVLGCLPLKVLAMEGLFHSTPPNYSPNHFNFWFDTESLKIKTQGVESTTTDNFKETSRGVWVFSSQLKTVSQKELCEIESLLKNPSVKYVVIDNRKDYCRNGDKIIRDNIRLVKPWYQKILNTSSLTEKEIYKLVWLPKEKVLDDLMNQTSFWPEEWLFSMKSYYNMEIDSLS